MSESLADFLNAQRADAATLQLDGDVLLAADPAMLGAFWNDPEEREFMRGAIVGAKQNLPIVETVVIATAALYGLYLVVTRGVSSKTVRRTVRRPDGSFEETEEETKIHDPTGPLKTIGAILGKLVP